MKMSLVEIMREQIGNMGYLRKRMSLGKKEDAR